MWNPPKKRRAQVFVPAERCSSPEAHHRDPDATAELVSMERCSQGNTEFFVDACPHELGSKSPKRMFERRGRPHRLLEARSSCARRCSRPRQDIAICQPAIGRVGMRGRNDDNRALTYQPRSASGGRVMSAQGAGTKSSQKTFGFRHISEIHVTTFVAGDHPGCKSLPKNAQSGAFGMPPQRSGLEARRRPRRVSKRGPFSGRVTRDEFETFDPARSVTPRVPVPTSP